MASTLQLHFRDVDTKFGVTRETAKAMAARLGLSETQLVHVALSRLAAETLPAYEPDDGPLTADAWAQLVAMAEADRPKARVIKRESLFG